MRNVTTSDGRRTWLTKVQIKGFFSQLAAAQRKKTTGESSAWAHLPDEEDEELLQEELAKLEKDREEEIHDVLSQIAWEHPIRYGVHDICSLSEAGN